MLKLFIYDHCPYCVKARMIFGIKSVPFELVTLLNDDEATPMSMISKKMVPILQKEDGTYTPESMDIVHYIDQLDGKPIVRSSPAHKELDAWYSQSRTVVYQLCMPRWVKAPLQEFETEEARSYFTKKKEMMVGNFDEQLAKTPALIEQMNGLLQKLDDLIESDATVHGELSEDDFHVFAVLRSLSIVKGMTYPAKIETYRQHMSKLSGVELHDSIAL